MAPSTRRGVRGERYVLLAAASRVPAQAEFDALLDALESAPYVALAAPDAAALDGGCVLIAAAQRSGFFARAAAGAARPLGDDRARRGVGAGDPAAHRDRPRRSDARERRAPRRGCERRDDDAAHSRRVRATAHRRRRG